MAPATRLLAGLGLLGAASLVAAAPAVVKPLAASPDYVEGGTLYGAKTGEARSILTARFRDGPATAARPISVRPDTALNAELASTTEARLGPRALPPVFGGYSVTVHRMPEPAAFTVRPQFQDGPSGRNDFLNLNVYLESNQPQPAGLEFSFAGAWLFPASDGPRPAPIARDDLVDVSFFVASQRSAGRAAQILVRDADTGALYVSEASSTGNSATIPLAGTRWARLDAHDPSALGGFAPPAFRRVDHLGLYVTVPSTTIDEPLRAYGVIYNVALHSFEFTLAKR